jgi:hypothetical protein
MLWVVASILTAVAFRKETREAILAAKRDPEISERQKPSALRGLFI